MQALWVLSQYLDADLNISNLSDIAHIALQNQDWHIRFGGAILIKKLLFQFYENNTEFNEDNTEWKEHREKTELLKITLQSDENKFIQFFGMIY